MLILFELTTVQENNSPYVDSSLILSRDLAFYENDGTKTLPGVKELTEGNSFHQTSYPFKCKNSNLQFNNGSQDSTINFWNQIRKQN